MSITIKDNTEEILSRIEKATQNGLEAIGLTAEGYAKENLYPGHGLDTGRLRNSITHATDDEAAYIGTNVEYAPYVELGARNRKGLHYLQQAATGHKAEYKEIMENALKNG